MGYVPDVVIEELRGSHQLGIFLNIQTEPPLHMWFGVNDIPAQIDGIDENGTIYYGGGRLSGVPSLETLVNGTSDSVEFSMSGIDPATGSAIISSIPVVRGAGVFVGVTTLDQYYQPMTAIIPIWNGAGSHLVETSQSVSGNANRSMTLSLMVTSGEDTRSRPARSLWSSAHQKAEHPTDLFCDGTALLARGVQPVWPKYS